LEQGENTPVEIGVLFWLHKSDLSIACLRSRKPLNLLGGSSRLPHMIITILSIPYINEEETAHSEPKPNAIGFNLS